MFNSFSSALSALKAHSVAVDTVGNNLANVNTTGYKASDVAFKDVVADAMGARTESGMGVSRPMSIRNYSQGAVQTSSGALDAAIQGRGFFTVKNDAGAVLFTRDGSFQVDREGFVVTLTGERVQQYVPGTGLQDIQVPSVGTAATATANISLVANLDAGATADASSRFTAPVEIVDSLGARHVLTTTFEKTGDNAWSYSITIPGEDLTSGGTTPVEVGTGTLAFDTSGNLVIPDPTFTEINISGFKNAAADMTGVRFSLVDGEGNPQLTQFTQTSSVSKTNQDGLSSAQLVSATMADGGSIRLRYANGRETDFAKLAVALVANPDTLAGAGSNMYRTTFETNDPSYGFADTGGRGRIKSSSLEGSTVDIAREFTNLIIFQRGYQANSRVITTADELSQEVLNLKR
jgi:flagellar hook protein FlgE